MSVNHNAVYTKNGATFASGDEAYANKNSLYSPELQASVNACYAQMLADGILLEPISKIWNQDTFQLTIVKVVSLIKNYNAAINFDVIATIEAAQQTGWTLETGLPGTGWTP